MSVQSEIVKTLVSLHLSGSFSQINVSQRVPEYAGKQSHLHVVGLCFAPFWHESVCGHAVVVAVVVVGAFVVVVVVAASEVSHLVPVKPVAQKQVHVAA